MENFEETVVNPNIHLKDIDGHVRKVKKVSKKQEQMEDIIKEQGSCNKLINGYFLFAATAIIILLIAIVARS